MSAPEQQPQRDPLAEMSNDELLAAFDSTVARKVHEGAVSVVPEDPPPSEKPPDSHAVIEVGLDMVRTGDLPPGSIDDYVAVARELDVDFGDAAAIREALRARQADQELAKQEEATRRARVTRAEAEQRIAELEREDENQGLLDAGLEILQTGSAMDCWDVATQLQEHRSPVLDDYLAEWSELDPHGASTWAATHPPPPPPPEPDWDAIAAEAAALHEHGRQDEIREAFSGRVAELADDPKAAAALPGALEMLQRVVRSDPGFAPGSPDEAVFLLEQAIRLSRAEQQERRDAEAIAKLVGPLDEKLHRSAYLSGDTEIEPRLLSRRDFEEAVVAEHMSSDRIVNRAHPRSAAERDADFYADFDRHAARHEQHAPTLPKGIATQIQADREARRRVGRIA